MWKYPGGATAVATYTAGGRLLTITSGDGKELVLETKGQYANGVFRTTTKADGGAHSSIAIRNRIFRPLTATTQALKSPTPAGHVTTTTFSIGGRVITQTVVRPSSTIINQNMRTAAGLDISSWQNTQVIGGQTMSSGGTTSVTDIEGPDGTSSQSATSTFNMGMSATGGLYASYDPNGATDGDPYDQSGVADDTSADQDGNPNLIHEETNADGSFTQTETTFYGDGTESTKTRYCDSNGDETDVNQPLLKSVQEVHANMLLYSTAAQTRAPKLDQATTTPRRTTQVTPPMTAPTQVPYPASSARPTRSSPGS